MTDSDTCGSGTEQIELALADLKLLYLKGETTINGVEIELLEGAEKLLQEGYEERYGEPRTDGGQADA